MFIVLEGIDGCGKSTQAKLIGRWLRQEKKKKVLLTAEPTKNRIGVLIRRILSGKEKASPEALALLFTADRFQHLKDEVNLALAKGKIVICERYYYSTIAYQSAQGLDWGWLLSLNKFARKPDLTILIDVNPNDSAKRTSTAEIFENSSFLKKVRRNYLKFRNELCVVDGNRGKEEVFEDIKNIISRRIR